MPTVPCGVKSVAIPPALRVYVGVLSSWLKPMMVRGKSTSHLIRSGTGQRYASIIAPHLTLQSLRRSRRKQKLMGPENRPQESN